MNPSKLTDLIVENIISIGVTVKMLITDSISENLTNSDLESTISRSRIYKDMRKKFAKVKKTLLS